MENNNHNSEFAYHLLNELIGLGARHVVVCPGSRSQALALAAARFEQDGKIRLHVRVDERSAAYFALGVALESGIPAPVIVTSGTAVVNLHPAVVEAHHAGVPMIVLTSDRPAELHGVGSSQTINQQGVFGETLRAEAHLAPPEQSALDLQRSVSELARDMARAAWASSLGQKGDLDESLQALLVATEPKLVAHPRLNSPGPVQLNLAFRDPLSGMFTPDAEDVTNSGQPVTEVTDVTESLGFREFRPDFPELRLTPEVGTVVVAGHGAGERAEEVARTLGAVLFAEVSSGARFGPNLVVSYRTLLADPELVESIRRVIVFGLPTLSREIPQLLARDVDLIVVHGTHAEVYRPPHSDPTVVSEILIDGEPNTEEFLSRWFRADRRVLMEIDDSLPAPDLKLAQDPHYQAQAKFASEELRVTRAPVSRQSLVEAVWKVTWPHDRLVLGPSLLIREMDRAVRGRKIRVYANRGTAGIDGVMSTATGVTAARKPSEPGTTRVLVGDLTMLHDIGALFLNPAEPTPRILIIVGNDRGGAMFDQLEVFHSAQREAYDRVMYVPQQVELKQIAEGYGWRYLNVSTRGDLDRVLASPVVEPTVLEVPLARGIAEETMNGEGD